MTCFTKMTCFDERLANEIAHCFQTGENPRATLRLYIRVRLTGALCAAHELYL